MFVLHSQLAKDCQVLGDLSLCRVLLMKDARYPWLILVPRREDVSEIFQLGAVDQRVLWEEASATASALASHCRADKMNVAALGNVVPQLHVHIIARSRQDEAWPGPVWGRAEPRAYADDSLSAFAESLGELLEPLGFQSA